jgi:Domain of unknown function (DUF6268)
MNMKLVIVLAAVGILNTISIYEAVAQKTGVKCTDEYCVPSVAGLPRSKGLSIEYELIPDYKISSTGKQTGFTNASGEVSKNSRLDIKLRLPIINKPALTVAFGFRFFREEFYFTEPSTPSYPLYLDLQDRSLRTVGTQLFIIRPTKTNRYFLLRMSADLNGDFSSREVSLSKYLKFSVAPMIGWKKSPDLSFAVGLAYGYTFGRPVIYPLFSYNRNFNKYWGFESLLPAYIKVRYARSDKTFWHGTTEINGASYRLNNKLAGLFAIDNPHLHRSEIRAYLSMEKEIHNWLWFGLKAGLRKNLQLNLTNSTRLNSDILIKNNLAAAPILSVNLFVVAPRGWINKK